MSKMSLLLASALMAALTVISGCGSKAPTPTPTPTDSKPANSTPITTPVPEPSASATKYVVVSDQSSASYSVHEKFLETQLAGIAVGKTSAFVGTVVIDNGEIKPSEVMVDLSALKSDSDRRDGQVRRVLDTDHNKLAKFTIKGAEGTAPTFKDGQEVELKLAGTMTIKGKEKPMVFDAKVKLEGDLLVLTASTTFKMTDFGVTPPNIGGFVSVVDEVLLDIKFTGKKN